MEKSERINQVMIKNSEIKEIDLDLVQVCRSICKIFYGNIVGTGFFIKLYLDDKELFCLMTNHHVVTKQMIESKDIINVEYKLEKELKKIKLDSDKRFIIYDVEIDITIIGTIPEDKIKNKYFLLPNLNKIDYINKNIYIPQFPEGKKLSYSEGKINNILNNRLIYDASTEHGSSGSPIFLKETRKVIGMHRKGNEAKQINYGIPIYSIIKTLESKKNDNSLTNKITNDIIEFFENGDFYVGQKLNGKKHGRGKIYFSDGNIRYSGQFENGKKEGNGKLFFETGEYYVGQFSDNKMNGNGKIYYKNDKIKYIGNFLDGKMEGYGKYIYENGEYYIGQFSRDLKNGKAYYIIKMTISNMKEMLLKIKRKEMVNIIMKIMSIILENF